MKVSKASSVFSSSIYSLSLLKTELYGREQPAVLVTHEYNLLEKLQSHSSVMTSSAPRTCSVFISFGMITVHFGMSVHDHIDNPDSATFFPELKLKNKV